jgi:phosphoglycolate phosphatase-like HAD superfamily hydrolase
MTTFTTSNPRASSQEGAQTSSPSRVPDFASARAIVWDVDGTLADTTDLGIASTNAVLAEASLPTISLEQYLHGTRYATPQRLAWHASGDIDDPRGTKLGAAFDAHYIALVDDRTAGFFPDVQALVRRIASVDGKGQAVLSNACGEYARKVCDVNDVMRHMASVVGADEVPAVKPSPLGLTQLCADAGWDAERCVYVGDSPSDGVAANAAGMMSVGCTWGAHDAEAQRGKFDVLVDTVQELEALLLP